MAENPPSREVYSRVTGTVTLRLSFDGSFEEYANITEEDQDRICDQWQQELYNQIGHNVVQTVQERPVEIVAEVTVATAAKLWRLVDRRKLRISAPKMDQAEDKSKSGVQPDPRSDSGLLSLKSVSSIGQFRTGPVADLLNAVAYANDDDSVLVRASLVAPQRLPELTHSLCSPDFVATGELLAPVSRRHRLLLKEDPNFVKEDQVQLALQAATYSHSLVPPSLPALTYPPRAVAASASSLAMAGSSSAAISEPSDAASSSPVPAGLEELMDSQSAPYDPNTDWCMGIPTSW